MVETPAKPEPSLTPRTAVATPAVGCLRCWVPSLGVAFRFLLAARLCSVFFMHISDCDETFNYWEPVSSLAILVLMKIVSPFKITLGTVYFDVMQDSYSYSSISSFMAVVFRHGNILQPMP